MINPYHAIIIDRLREAAKEHEEVAALLDVLSESFTDLSIGDSTFVGDEKQRVYLLAAMDAAAFAAVDRGLHIEFEEY